MSKQYQKNNPISEATGEIILKAYSETKSLRKTWSKYCYLKHGYEQIRLFLKEKGIVQPPRYRKEEEVLIPDPDRVPFTDATMNLEEEFNTRLWK